MIKLLNKDVALFDLFQVAKVNVAIGELLLHYDYAIGDRFIIDYGGLTLGHLQKFNPLLIAKLSKIFKVTYSKLLKLI